MCKKIEPKPKVQLYFNKITNSMLIIFVDYLFNNTLSIASFRDAFGIAP